MMNRKIISTAAFFGMTAIILGAFGAHGLRKVLAPEQLIAFETGVRYQMYHSLLLLFLGLDNQIPLKKKKTILVLVILGVLFFSGSIYLLATTAISSVDFRSIGFITPVGGLLLIVAWGILGFHFMNKSR